jgi:hypothetical protein
MTPPARFARHSASVEPLLHFTALPAPKPGGISRLLRAFALGDAISDTVNRPSNAFDTQPAPR